MALRVTSSPDDPDADEGFAGSNVDLGFDANDIGQELVVRSRGQDRAFKMLRDATEQLVAARHELRARWGSVLDRTSKGKTATVGKALAEAELRQYVKAVEDAEADRDLAATLLRVLQSQLTAAQTREKMWRAQFELETRG